MARLAALAAVVVPLQAVHLAAARLVLAVKVTPVVLVFYMEQTLISQQAVEAVQVQQVRTRQMR
jgi:hypothetical protein